LADCFDHQFACVQRKGWDEGVLHVCEEDGRFILKSAVLPMISKDEPEAEFLHVSILNGPADRSGTEFDNGRSGKGRRAFV
jgi:hypothetical protein